MASSAPKSAANTTSPELAVEVSPIARPQSARNKKEEELGAEEVLLLRQFFALLDQWERQQQP